jgi:hypothetical protein
VSITCLSIQFAALQGERLPGKSLFFVRVNPKGVSEKMLESDVAVGEIQGSALDTFKALLAEVFLPLLQEQGSWGKMPPQHTKDFLTGVHSWKLGLTAGCTTACSATIAAEAAVQLRVLTHACADRIRPQVSACMSRTRGLMLCAVLQVLAVLQLYWQMLPTACRAVWS